MLDVKQISEEVAELESSFYGDEDGEGGACEDNYDCAEWARRNADTLFSTIRNLTDKVAKLSEEASRLSEAESLLSDARSLLNDIHGYDYDTYREIGVFLYGEGEDE